jgi:hypothetical protein
MKTRAARILAFEPDSSCVPFLHENLKLNRVYHSDRLELSHKFVGVSDNEQEVRLDTLAASIQYPCLIKMDVDGAEEHILKGANALNRLTGVRWLIETHSKQLEISCEGTLRAAGFQTRIIPNAWWRVFLPELRPIEHNRWLAAWKN